MQKTGDKNILWWRRVKSSVLLTVLVTLAACATQRPASMDAAIQEEAARYRNHAKGRYTPPGPPSDPWGPYIVEAAKRFDVPEAWIREVMFRESGGKLYSNGQLITSIPGAMGLMQVMPPTYDELRVQYNLGNDPYNPRDNILAGAAYIRQMYDIYGNPGFLAAYNAGPGRLDVFLQQNKILPLETRRYVAAIGPRIAGAFPQNRSYADVLVSQHARPSFERIRLANTQNEFVRPALSKQQQLSPPKPIQVAQLAATDNGNSAPSYTQTWQPFDRGRGNQGKSQHHVRKRSWSGNSDYVAGVGEPRHKSTQDKYNSKVTFVRNKGPWAIQVGSFASAKQASYFLGKVKDRIRAERVWSEVAAVDTRHGKFYRARLSGFDRQAAQRACRQIHEGKGACTVVSP